MMRLAQDIFALGIVFVGLVCCAWMLWDTFYGKEAIEARDNAKK
jgi:hypothetical protein